MLDLFKDVKLTKGYNRSLVQDFTKENIEFISNEVYELHRNIRIYNNVEEFLANNPENRIEILKLKEMFIYNEHDTIPTSFPECQENICNSFEFQAIVFEQSTLTKKYIIENFGDISRLTQNVFLLIEFIDLELISFLNRSCFINGHVRIVFCGVERVLNAINEFTLNEGLAYDYLELDTNDKKSYLERWPFLHNNKLLYCENRKFNSGQFEKLFINKNGRIGINIFDNIDLGQVSDVPKISDIIKLKTHEKYLEVAEISIDSVSICNQCEFRYMCVDLQIPQRNLKDDKKYFKQRECRYNPFISKWKNEEGYRSLKECGVISNEYGLFVDKQRVEDVNMGLWIEN